MSNTQDIFRLHADEQTLTQDLRESCPEVFDLAEETIDRTLEFVVQSWQPHEAEPLRFAVPIVAHQIANTTLDLLAATLSGRGRAALSASRVLYELAVVSSELADKSLREETAARFTAHNAVGAVLFANLTLPLEYKRGKRLKRARHYLKTVGRDYAGEVEEAVALYGSNFPGNWAGQNLLDRATRFGLDEHYNFYRFTSSFIHGSMVSAFGTYAPTEGAPILRLGPALLPIPLAYSYGLTFAVNAFCALGRAFSIQARKPCVASIQRLLKQTDPLSEALELIDNSTWPDHPPDGMVATLMVDPRTNIRRWMVHIPELDLIADADPPVLAEKDAAVIEAKIREMMEDSHPLEPATLMGWISIGIAGTPIQKKANAQWQPAGVFLMQRTGKYQRLR